MKKPAKKSSIKAHKKAKSKSGKAAPMKEKPVPVEVLQCERCGGEISESDDGICDTCWEQFKREENDAGEVYEDYGYDLPEDDYDNYDEDDY